VKSTEKNSPARPTTPASSTPEEQPINTPVAPDMNVREMANLTKDMTMNGPIDTVARWHDYRGVFWDPGGPPSEPDWCVGGPKTPEHRRFISEHLDSGWITYIETRGLLKTKTAFPFGDLEEISTDSGTEDARKYASLRETASSWLREAGEIECYTVSEGAEQTKESAGTEESSTRGALRRWSFQIGTKYGFVSRTAIAAEFGAASDWVHRLTEGNEQLRQAIYSLVEVAYRMQFEASGHHEQGIRNVAGRAQGPKTKAERANRKKELIKRLYDAFAADVANEKVARNPKAAEGALYDQINAELKERKLSKIEHRTLTNELRPLIKLRFPSAR
jgi:hypothetical protein